MKYVLGICSGIVGGLLVGGVLLEVEGKRRVEKVYGKGYWGYWKASVPLSDFTPVPMKEVGTESGK